MSAYRTPSPSWLSCLSVLGLLAATAPLRAAGPIPIEPLLRPFAVHDAELSRDGRHLGAVTATSEGARSLLILDLATRKPDVIKAPASFDVGTFQWITNDDVLFTAGSGRQYAFDLFHARLGHLSAAAHFSVNDLTTVVGLPRARPNRALVWILVAARDREPDNRLVEMSTDFDAVLPSGTRASRNIVKTFSPPAGGVPVDWLALENGELGYCQTYAGRKFTLHRYLADQDGWAAVDLDLDRYRVVGVDPDLSSLWVAHFEAGQGCLLQRFDPVAGKFDEPVWRDATYGFGGARLHFSRKTKQLLGVTYNQRRRITKWFAEPFLSAQKLVQKNFPTSDVLLTSFDDNETKLLFRVEGAQDPGRVVLLDLAQNSLETLSEAAPWLQGEALLPTFPMSYTTAEGLKEDAYVTLPAGASAAAKVPLVVLVHDGPWQRDVWRFDPEVQFLASRGYAVLQPNYRGSTGYSPAISHDDRFALKKMHEDVTAAARAGSALEMIDRHRLAIVGHGFGGFLAMTGASLEPDLYTAAVSINGTLDWERFVRELSYYPATRADYEIFRDFLGQPGKDRDTFAEYSPLKHAASVKAAVLLAFSENPNYSATEQSKELAGRLSRQGTPCETFALTTGYYDRRALDSWNKFYQRLDAFLASRLRAPATP